MNKITLEFTKEELDLLLVSLQDNNVQDRQDLGLAIMNGEHTVEEPETRKEMWLKVIDDVYKIGADANKVGNDDLTEEDYYFMHQIEIIFSGYKETY